MENFPLLLGLAILIGVLTHLSFWKVGINEYGLPSSWFTGRYKLGSKTEPIGRALQEGWHKKPFWWNVTNVDAKTNDFTFQASFVTENGKGTATIDLTIQYTSSFEHLHLWPNFTPGGVHDALKSIAMDYISLKVYPMDFEDIRKSSGEFGKELLEIYCGGSSETDARTKGVYEPLEQRYGRKLIAVNFGEVKQPRELEEARNNQRVEELQRKSERIEMDTLIELKTKLKGEFPNLTDLQLIEAIQVHMKKADKKIQAFDLGSLESLSGILREILSATGGAK